MPLQNPPKSQTQMLIRRPAAEVFEAFIDPALTTRFWFTNSSGRLEVGKTVTWAWEMYGVSTDVEVKALEPNRRIQIAWDDPPRTVEWRFDERADGTTMVFITEEGFRGSDEEVIAQALDSKGGFTCLLAGLKAFLEYGISLNLVADQYPDAHRKPEG